MIFYAIRHKPTGWYMPVGGSKHTKDEPKANCVPRLFKRKSDVTNALKWWLEGVWGIYHDSATWSHPEDWGLDVVKMSHRKAEEMEVIRVELRTIESDSLGSYINKFAQEHIVKMSETIFSKETSDSDKMKTIRIV